MTIPRAERTQILGEMLHQLTDNLAALGIIYSIDAMLIGNRLVNVANPPAPNTNATWNADVWDVR